MQLLPEIATWTTRTLALLALGGALIPLIPSGSWIIRVWDFPRTQMLTIALLVACLAITLALKNVHRTESLIILPIMLLASAMQAFHIVPYTRLWPPSVAHTESINLRLLITNLDVRNSDPPRTSNTIENLDTDVILLIELDETLKADLAGVRDQYPHRIEVIRDEGLGIALWSKHPIIDDEIKHLVSDRRASIHCTLKITDERRVRFIGLHPTPPALLVQQHDTSDERYDSDIRDAELVLVARAVAEHASQRSPDPIIVAGDFNDVAWSSTTRRFQALSALKDPRIGRGLLNTYHADYPPLRYPLDHIFLSDGIKVGHISRIHIPGSDHFGVLAELEIQPHTAPQNPTPDPDTIENANESIEEGREDANEHNEDT